MTASERIRTARTYASAALELANWRGADADAHEQKAEALGLAGAHLEASLPIVDNISSGILEAALSTLTTERERHLRAAALIRDGRAA